MKANLNPELMIRRSKGRQAVQGVMSAFFALACIAAAASAASLSGNPAACWITAGLGAIYFGQKAVWQLSTLSSDRPLLQITEEGIADYSSAWSVGFLPWSAVKSVQISSVLLEKYVSISLVDPERCLHTLPAWKRLFISVRTAMGYAPVSVSMGAVNGRGNDIVKTAANYL